MTRGKQWFTALAYRSMTPQNYMGYVLGPTGVTVVTMSRVDSGSFSTCHVASCFRQESAFGCVHALDTQPTYATRSTALLECPR